MSHAFKKTKVCNVSCQAYRAAEGSRLSDACDPVATGWDLGRRAYGRRFRVYGLSFRVCGWELQRQKPTAQRISQATPSAFQLSM